jgi:TRAP transporter TAXI family solute receptor
MMFHHSFSKLFKFGKRRNEMNRKKMFLTGCAAALLVFGIGEPVFAGGGGEGQASGKPTYLTLAAVPASSGLYPYCVSIGKLISTVMPKYQITVSESGGNVDNTQRLRKGEIKIANSISNTDYESYTGTGTTFKGSPYKDFRILWYYEVSPIQICVAADSGIKTIWDLNGKKFNPGGTGTAASVVIHAAFDALGIKPDYFEAGQADAADAYSNRQIVGVVKTGPYPDSFIMQINANRPVRLLDIAPEDMKKIRAAIPSVSQAVVPAGSYKGVDDEAACVSTFQGIQVAMGFSQEDGYAMFKAMWEDGKKTWQTAYPVGASRNVPEITLQAASTPLHPGTVQYLKEHGFTVPAELIPPEYKE